MAADILGKILYLLVFFALFTVGIIYMQKFIHVEARYMVKLDDLEDSVIVNRVVKCFSEDGKFGAIEEGKFDEGTLKGCFGDRVGFDIDLVKKKASGGGAKHVEVGDTKQVVEVKRYVLVESGKGYRAARLEVGYNKNGG